MNKIDQLFNRRKFIGLAGMGAAALAVSPRFAFAEETTNIDRKIRIGIIGGGFGTGSFRMTMVAESPVPINVGGDYLDGRIYFVSGSHLCSYQIK